MQRTGAGIADFIEAGEIGASMFSPRPARGYRFHSLQVEIIAGPRNVENDNHFHQFIQSRAVFSLESECLTAKNPHVK